MSVFDANTFAQLTINEANSTESIPIPAGEYPATIKEKKIETWQAKDGSSSGLKMLVFWEVEDPMVKEVTGRDKSIVRQEMMFDLTDSGMLDMGKGMNVRLGRLREATGLNRPGEAFSFDMLPGRQAVITVGHRADKNDPNTRYAEVKDCAPL